MKAFLLHRRLPAFLCGAFLLAAPVLAETVKGNGVIRTQARPVSGFTAVALGMPAHVEIRQGSAEGVTIEADENLLPLIETTVQRGSLEIKPARKNLQLESKAIKVVVQARQLDGLAIGGSGVMAAQALKADRLKLDLGGSGEIDIGRLEAQQVAVAIGGSGNVRLAGVSKRVSVAIGGSGSVDAPSLVADEAEVSVAGSGDTSLAVRTSLQVTVAGSGNVRYSGDPSVTRTVVGSGRIRRVGPLPQ